MQMEFKVGDKAVVPNQGVGVVTEVKTLLMGGVEQPCYIIKLMDTGVTYHCPVGRATANNVRDVMPVDRIEDLYEILRDRDKPADKQTWNRRYREYTKKITTNDPLEVAAVLRDLAVLRLGKTLSFGERKMYDRAHGLVVQEVSAVRDIDEDVVKKELEILFKEADEAAQNKGKVVVSKKKRKS